MYFIVGFDDALKSLDKLNSIPFKLPVDLAVRPFSNIKDAFWPTYNSHHVSSWFYIWNWIFYPKFPKGLLLSLPLGSFIRNCVIGANFVTYVHIFLVLHIFTFTTTIINTIQFSICRYLVYTAWCKNLSMVSFFQAIPSWNTAWWVKVKFTHQKYTQLFKM